MPRPLHALLLAATALVVAGCTNDEPAVLYSPAPTTHGPTTHGPSPVPSDLVIEPDNSQGSTAPPAVDISRFPSERTTGVKPGAKLRPVGEVTVKRRGAVVENLEVHGKLNIQANDVTVRNVKVIGEGDWSIIQRQEFSGAVIEDVEIAGDGATRVDWGVLNQGGMITVRRANIHTVADGIGTDHGIIEDCYLHDFKKFPGDHVDGMQVGGSPRRGLSLRIRHNTILNQLEQTSAIILAQDFSRTRDILIKDNLLAGGGYTVYGGAGKFGVPSNIRIVDNVFSRRFFAHGGFYGPLAYWEPSGRGNAFTGNLWEDTGRPVKS